MILSQTFEFSKLPVTRSTNNPKFQVYCCGSFEMKNLDVISNIIIMHLEFTLHGSMDDGRGNRSKSQRSQLTC